jgi:hypothetical protein
MKGSNTITLNEATMEEAIQHYFDTVLFKENKSPKVTKVRGNSNPGFAYTFEVSVTEDLYKKES